MTPGECVAVDGEPHAWITAEQSFEGDPCFQPSQGRAQTVVAAMAERKVWSVVTGDVEYVGRSEASRIAIVGGETDEHLFARGDLHSLEIHRLGRHAERGMRHRGGEAHELVDAGGELL